MKYESKQQQILRPAEVVFGALSKFSNFTPMLSTRVDSWQADDDTCSFMAKGFRVSLSIIERTPNTLVKVGQGQGGAPFPFTFWIQFKELSCSQTRMRLVLDVELNTMMKMMIGGKLQQALDNIASQIAQGFK